MVHIFYVILAFALLALLSKMSPPLKAFFYKLTGSTMTADELRALKKSRVKESDYYIALDMVQEHGLEISRESLFQRAVEQKTFRSIVEVMAQLSVTSREFSWDFLCKLADSPVGIDLLIQLIYHQNYFDQDRERVFDSAEDENPVCLFYRALIEYTDSKYENAAETFIKSLDYTDEKELFHFAIDSVIKSKSQHKSDMCKDIFSRMSDDSSQIYRMSDTILVELQTKHAPAKAVELKEDETALVSELIKVIESLLGEDEGRNIEFYKQLGSLYHLLGDFDTAMIWLRRSHENDPEDQLVNYECYLVETKRNNDIAKEYLEAASEGFNEIEDIAEFFSGE